MTTRRNFIKSAAIGTTAISLNTNVLWASENNYSPKHCHQSSRNIPIIADVDIVVVGGSSGAVSAAAEASRSGAKVFLIGYQPYLGDDICGCYQFWLNHNEHPGSDLAKRIFQYEKLPTPLHVKSVLDNELIDNDVDFLISSYVSDVLVDSKNQLSGVVITNRSGRQAIKAKIIIDATDNSIVAGLAGAEFHKFKSGEYTFKYVGVGNKSNAVEGIEIEEMQSPVVFNNKVYQAFEYSINFFVDQISHSSMMEIEHTIRDKVWNFEQVDSSDLILQPSLRRIKGEVSLADDLRLCYQNFSVNHFQPLKLDQMFVLGKNADLPDEIANSLNRPVNLMQLGSAIGKLAANKVKSISLSGEVQVRVQPNRSVKRGDVHEILMALRPTELELFATCSQTTIPILGEYDVVIMGGGTAGAPAGIGAIRNGAKTLVLEYLHGLGGIGTLGLVGLYFDGNRSGFTAEIDFAVDSMIPSGNQRKLDKLDGAHFVTDCKAEYYRRQIRDAGGEIWFGALGSGAFVENGIVKGIIVTTPLGRGVVLSKIVIDSTGSADIAIAAGADYCYTNQEELAVQGAGIPKQDPEDHFVNSDWTFINDNDTLDVSRAFIEAKVKFSNSYDIGQLPQTRERRRIIGEYTLSVYDIINKKHFYDTISYHISAFDTHGYTVDPYFALKFPESWHVKYDSDLPLRCLLPKGLDGILVTGLGVSAHRDAMPVIRMQACLQNQGYAVGYLAATSISENKKVQEVDIKKIQRHLVELGSVPKRVLTDIDSPMFSDDELKESFNKVTENYEGIEVLLTNPEKSIRLLENQLPNTIDNSKALIYSTILGILGQKAGWKNIAEEIEKYSDWDEGWNFKGMGQKGPSMSRLDSLIISLGKTKEVKALPVILKKAKLLNPQSKFSHFRAIASACENIGDSSAANELVELLQITGIESHSVANYKVARQKVVPGIADNSLRNLELRQIHLARSLYKCGDHQNIGKTILMNYAKGLQGHYFLHASSVLKANH